MRESMTDECEQVLVVRDPASEAEAIVAVHSTKLGPAHGGIRRWAYVSQGAAMADVVALARAMTQKCALAEVPAGGGKAVILDHPGLGREGAYRLVGRTVEQLGGAFYTGPDVNTTAEDLRWVGEETRFVATDAADGPGDLAAATADGVLSAWLALAEELDLQPADLHCVVPGLGAVGMGLCERLAALGTRLSVFDVVPSRVEQAVRNCGATAISAEQVTQTACDIFSPCALGGVLTEAVAVSLPARGVCGAANNVFVNDVAAEIMHRRSVPVVPDFIANAGALIQGAIWNLQQARIAPERLHRIGFTTREVLQRSRADDRAPSQVALELARERLER
jgi:leucine dehydrogenase